MQFPIRRISDPAEKPYSKAVSIPKYYGYEWTVDIIALEHLNAIIAETRCPLILGLDGTIDVVDVPLVRESTT